jgi:hypothetical protein
MNINITTILADSYRFFIGNLSQLAGLFLPILLIVATLERGLMATAGSESMFWTALVSLLVYPLYTGAMLLLLAQRTRRETPTNGQLLRAAVALWWPLLVLTFIVGVAVFSGVLLLIVPGIWIAVRLSFAEIYLVVEGLMPLAAMRKSHDATEGLFWVILPAAASIYVPLIALDFLSEWMLDSYGGNPALGVISDTLLAFLGLFVNVVIYRIYLLSGQSRAQA